MKISSLSSSDQSRVLLVDDNPTNLQVLTQALGKEGYELLIARCGEDALKIASKAHPELILLDINMPGIDGFETCRQLQGDEQTSDISIIFLSARDAVEDKVRGLSLGGVDYISKPFHFEEVIARVRAQLDLRQARHRSEELLANIFPKSIVNRLHSGESQPVDEISAATIFFCDLQGFTPYAAGHSAARVVADLNRVFTRIDALVEEFGLEKIKTIGDSYMAAAGVPDPVSDHAERTVHCARKLLAEWASIQESIHQPFGLRIGIHSGPVVAGVIGEKKFAYDVWGDTVNTASRLEESGIPGHIHLSQAVVDQLDEDQFPLQSRGELELRGIGTTSTYLL